VTVPTSSVVTDEIRAFYESHKGYEQGTGKVVIHYAAVGGDCVHCCGSKCDRCYTTGKLVRFIRQTPWQGGIAVIGLNFRKLFLWSLVAFAAFNIGSHHDSITSFFKVRSSQTSAPMNSVDPNRAVNAPPHTTLKLK
jgi:hypothetical protein